MHFGRNHAKTCYRLNHLRQFTLRKTSAGNFNPDGSNLEIDPGVKEVIRGQIKNAPYVSTYLITNIKTPTYSDINQNGIVDKDDLGGWTKFNYFKKYGINPQTDSLTTSSPNWYRWRIPYTGLDYNQGSIADSRDDLGTATSGLKEVYYLKAIETKTHIAFFITNKTRKTRFTWK